MRMTVMQDDELDRLLADAARTAVVPSAGLMDRVLADAMALQPGAPGFALPSARPRPGLVARLSGVFGGGPALAGLGTAAVVGLALGYLSPTTMDYLTGTATATADDTAEFFPTPDFLTTEG